MIAATRILFLDTTEGRSTVPIEIQVPSFADESWNCEFSIGWPEGRTSGFASGQDSAQALYLAMQKIAVYLYASAHHKAGKLYLERPGYGYGFPLPLGGRDNAIGGDKKL